MNSNVDHNYGTGVNKPTLSELKLLPIISLLGNSKFDTKICDLVMSIPTNMYDYYTSTFPVLSVIDKNKYPIDLNNLNEFNLDILLTFQNNYQVALNTYNKQLWSLYNYISYLINIGKGVNVNFDTSFCNAGLPYVDNGLLIYPNGNIVNEYIDKFTSVVLLNLGITDASVKNKYFRIVDIGVAKYVVLPIEGTKSVEYSVYKDAVKEAVLFASTDTDIRIDIILEDVRNNPYFNIVNTYEKEDSDIQEYLEQLIHIF